MAYLDYGLSLVKVIVITGEVGAGKTTLVRNLFRQLEAHNLIAAQWCRPIGCEDTLRSVAASFGLQHEDLTKSALLKNLEDFLGACHRQGKRACWCRRGAEPDAACGEELRMLSNFQNNERSLIQTFLLGKPEFSRHPAKPGHAAAAQRVVASYHLGPLDADETRGYIEHRLRTVAGKAPRVSTARRSLCCTASPAHSAPSQYHLRPSAAVRLSRREDPFRRGEVNEVIAD